MRRALRFACDAAFLLLAALSVAHAVAPPFPAYVHLVKPWLPGFRDVIFFAVALLAARDALRDEPDRSLLASAGALGARWARRWPRAAETAGVVVLAAIVLLVSLALHDKRIAPLDEGLNFYGASGLLQGRLLYRDTVVVYPPGSFYLTAGVLSIFGESLYPMRIVSIVLQVALCAATYGVVRKTSRSPLLGIVAASLMLSFGLTHGRFVATAAWFALLVSLLALWAFDPAPKRLWLTGALAALTALFKQDIVVFLLIGLGAAVLAAPREGWPPRAGALLRLGLPVAAVALGAAALLWAAGVPLSDQWACVAARPFRFATSSGYTLPIPGPHQAPIAYLPILFHVGAAATLAFEHRAGKRVEPAIVTAIVYGLLSMSGYFARADLWHLAYAIPPAFVSAPKALDGVALILRRARRALFSAGFVGVVLPAGFALYQLEKYPLAQARVAAFRTEWEAFETPRARGVLAAPHVRREIDGIVEWIREKCAAGEPFFVAPISPILYFLADRPAAARFILITPEFGTSPAEQAEIVEDLCREHPKLLLLNRLPVDGKPFAAYASEIHRACFAGREPDREIGDFLSFPGMPAEAR